MGTCCDFDPATGRRSLGFANVRLFYECMAMEAAPYNKPVVSLDHFRRLVRQRYPDLTFPKVAIVCRNILLPTLQLMARFGQVLDCHSVSREEYSRALYFYTQTAPSLKLRRKYHSYSDGANSTRAAPKRFYCAFVCCI